MWYVGVTRRTRPFKRSRFRRPRRAICATGVSAQIPRRCGENGLGRPAASDLERIAFECFFLSVAPTLRGQNSDSMKRATVAFIYVGDSHASCPSALPLTSFNPSFRSSFAMLQIMHTSTINRETSFSFNDTRLLPFAVSSVHDCFFQFLSLSRPYVCAGFEGIAS